MSLHTPALSNAHHHGRTQLNACSSKKTLAQLVAVGKEMTVPLFREPDTERRSEEN